MGFLNKIQNKSDKTKRMILWAVIVVLGAGLLLNWVINVKKNFKELASGNLVEKLGIPPIDGEISKFQNSLGEDITLKSIGDALENTTPTD